MAERPVALPPGFTKEGAVELHDKLDIARRHVVRGREIVAKQRALIASIRDRGRDSASAEDLLQSFERTLGIFEADLAALER